MKKMIAAFCLMSISLTAFASSTAKMSYDFEAIDLLNTVHDCSPELIAATQNGRVVLKAEGNFESAAYHALYTYTLTIGRRLPAPGFGEVEMSKLVIIKRLLAAKQINASELPQIWEKTECRSLAIAK